MNEPFVLPSNCSRITAGRCTVKLVFWYDRGYYVMTFMGKTSNDYCVSDNRHFTMVQTSKNSFFSYDIGHTCRDEDDCALLFAGKKISEMTQRLFNITGIYSDLERVINQQPSASHYSLACFDINEAVRQCTIPGISGACQIVYDLTKHRIHARSCQRNTGETTSVNVYDSNGFAFMTVQCNQMLCNGPLTIAAVKKVLNHHNITDIDGRLPGTSSLILFSNWLLLLTSVLIFIELK